MAKSSRKPNENDSSEPAVDDEPVFLGSLRSEFDTDDELDERWGVLSSVAEVLRSVFLRGDLSEEEALEAFSRLRLVDSEGAEWTVGSTTGEWYRRSSLDAPWVRSLGPSTVTPMNGVEPAWLRGGATVLVEAAHQARAQAPQDEVLAPAEVVVEDTVVEDAPTKGAEAARDTFEAEHEDLTGLGERPALPGDPGELLGAGSELTQEVTAVAHEQEEDVTTPEDAAPSTQGSSNWDDFEELEEHEGLPAVSAAPAPAAPAPVELPGMPASYLPDETAGWAVAEPSSSPAPRVNSVASSDVFGWQPAKRSDGPADELTVPSGWVTEVPQASAPAEHLRTSEEEVTEDEEALFLPDELLASGSSGSAEQDEDDDFFLPDDLFYDPEADK